MIVEKNNNLPSNWPWAKLGDVCYTTSGGTPSRGNSAYYNGNIPWVKSGELDKGIILDTEEKISEEALQNSSAKLFPKGTLLIALYGATIGKLAFLGIDAATNQAVCGIYKNKNINSDFLFNFLFFKKQYLVKQSIGGAQPNISQGILKNLDIPLPPLPEQEKIVEKIEELFSGLDNGVASLKKAKAQIRLYRQSVLASAFSGKLLTPSPERIAQNEILKAAEPKVEYSNQLPTGWKWVSLKELTSVLGDGLHGTPKYTQDGTYFFINGNNLSDGKIEIKASTKRVTEEEYNKYKKPLNDRTIFVSINGTIGNTAFFNDEKIILGKSACYFNLKENNDKRYIRYFLKTQRFTNYANKTATGSTIKNVSLQAMRELQVPVPPTFQLQTQIVEEIEKRFSEADNLEKAIDESLAKSETLRQSILKKAFEGKLV